MLSQLTGVVLLKDLDSKFLAITKECSVLLFGHPKADLCVGLYDKDMNCPAVRLAKDFRDQDKLVLSGKTLKTITLSSWNNNVENPIYSIKQPYYDNDNIIRGTMIQSMIIDNSLFRAANFIFDSDYNKRLTGHKKVSYTIDRNQINLSKKAHDCLFLLLRNLSNYDIAIALHCSPRTVEHYITELKQVFDVNKKSAIVDAAINCGYAFDIPKSIMTEHFTAILEIKSLYE
jgi:DNA-binding CsgD family transcriptional regulator